MSTHCAKTGLYHSIGPMSHLRFGSGMSLGRQGSHFEFASLAPISIQMNQNASFQDYMQALMLTADSKHAYHKRERPSLATTGNELRNSNEAPLHNHYLKTHRTLTGWLSKIILGLICRILFELNSTSASRIPAHYL